MVGALVCALKGATCRTRKHGKDNGPSAWRTKQAATEIAEGVTENGMMESHTTVTALPPEPSRFSGSEKKRRETWDSAKQVLSVYDVEGEVVRRYTTCGLVSAMVIVRQNGHLSRESVKAGYRITISPAD